MRVTPCGAELKLPPRNPSICALVADAMRCDMVLCGWMTAGWQLSEEVGWYTRNNAREHTLRRRQGCSERDRAARRVYPMRERREGCDASAEWKKGWAQGKTERRAGFRCMPAPCSSLSCESRRWGGLAQKLAVEELDKDFPYSGLGEAVRPVHGDELAADALELRQGHGRGW